MPRNQVDLLVIDQQEINESVDIHGDSTQDYGPRPVPGWGKSREMFHVKHRVAPWVMSGF